MSGIVEKVRTLFRPSVVIVRAYSVPYSCMLCGAPGIAISKDPDAAPLKAKCLACEQGVMIRKVQPVNKPVTAVLDRLLIERDASG